MIYRHTQLMLILLCAAHLYAQIEGENNLKLIISMPPVKTTYPDQYICYAHRLDSVGDIYVLSSKTEADRSAVHHVATGVCEEPMHTDRTWDCTRDQGHLCKGEAVNFGGWDEFTKKNGIFKFPEDVSFRVGNNTKLRYFMIEIHFMDPVQDLKPPVANITLDFVQIPSPLRYQTYSFLNSGVIPAKRKNGFFSEIACAWTRPNAFAFRYYLHTHHYGYLVEGFLVRNSTWTLIGSQLSMDKEKDLYDIPGGPIEITQGDVLVARCLYINNKDEPVKFGMSEEEEMCNFQIDIGFRPQDADHFERPPACSAPSPGFRLCDHPQTSGIC
ncbi:peptidyl-glycine alpha-amidating monooxygenase B-like [Mya arenaria]|uniref:peptidyl-glycine alpha-amidating monooxygenase B-like n=1 Tax=Mya arenaria TaxID=6604 RepID=UPI0022DFC0DC|nr:peptidyl-glycine alpha-amidating monooxygenase B-like [Mya arenaria]